MQYMLMCVSDEGVWADLPEADRTKVMQGYVEFHSDLTKSGHYRASGRLAPASSATTLRGKSGKTVIFDGPFAETKEQFGGFTLIECKDLDEALALAKRIPTLPYGGTVEVRPMAEDVDG